MLAVLALSGMCFPVPERSLRPAQGADAIQQISAALLLISQSDWRIAEAPNLARLVANNADARGDVGREVLQMMRRHKPEAVSDTCVALPESLRESRYHGVALTESLLRDLTSQLNSVESPLQDRENWEGGFVP